MSRPKAATETANLQSRRITIKQAAAIMNVSERTVYMCQRVVRSGRQDLVAEIRSGEMSVNAAIQIIDGDHRPDRYTVLVKAWNRCSEDDKGRFLLAMPPAMDSCLKSKVVALASVAERVRALATQNDPDALRASITEIAAELDSLMA